MFFKWANHGLFFVYFSLFKQTLQFLWQIYAKKFHPVFCAGIRTHNLLNVSLLTLPLGQGTRPCSLFVSHSLILHSFPLSFGTLSFEIFLSHPTLTLTLSYPIIFFTNEDSLCQLAFGILPLTCLAVYLFILSKQLWSGVAFTILVYLKMKISMTNRFPIVFTEEMIRLSSNAPTDLITQFAPFIWNSLSMP